MRIILDTNFLIDVIRFRIDLDATDLIGAHQLIILSSVERELIDISRKTSNASIYAKTALKLIKELDIKILKSKENPDNAMVKLADDKTLIATNDRELRKRLKALGRKTIYLKSKKHLAIG